VRMVYLDESGISIKERFTVVAGVIINADQQWKIVEKYVQELIEEYVPEESRAGFAFRGTDLFHGAKVFDRRYYPRERSREALKKLLRIPAELRVPVVYGYHDKSSDAEFEKAGSARQVAAVNQAFTYSLCVVATERYMRELAEPSEVATLVAENNDNAHKAIKLIHAFLKDKNPHVKLVHLSSYLKEIGGSYLPISKIVDTVHFASKNEAILLQIADVCAFIVRCFLEKKPHAEDFLNAFTDNTPSLLAPSKTGEDDDPAGYKIFGFSSRSTNSASLA